MIGASEATLQETSHPEKVQWTPLCVREGASMEGYDREHTKTLPSHVTQAGINGAFWLVREGSHGDRSVVLLFNCGAGMYMSVCVFVLEETKGIVA